MIEIILSTLILNLIFFVSYLKLNTKNYLNFVNYFFSFVAYTIFLFSIFYLFQDNSLGLASDEKVVFFLLYILFFMSFFLTASPRYIKSPSYLIFNKLNDKKKCSLNDLFKHFKKNKVLKLRFADLKKQKIIEFKKNSIKLKKNLGIIIYIIFFIKKFYKLKSEG